VRETSLERPRRACWAMFTAPEGGVSGAGAVKAAFPGGLANVRAPAVRHVDLAPTAAAAGYAHLAAFLIHSRHAFPFPSLREGADSDRRLDCPSPCGGLERRGGGRDVREARLRVVPPCPPRRVSRVCA